MVTKLYFIIIIILVITQTISKQYSHDFRSVRLRIQKSWIYLERMRFAPGQVQVYFWASLQTQNVPSNGKYSFTLTIVPQKLWEKQLNQKCQNSQQVINNGQNQQITNSPTQIKQYITIPLNIQNSLISSSTLKFTIPQQTTYYFILTDCKKLLINQYFNQKSRIDVELNLKSNSHNYGSDQFTYTWLFPLFIAISYWLIYLIDKNTNKQYEQTNWPVVIVKIILWAQLVGLSFLYFGHIIYIVGKGNMYAFFGFVYLLVSAFMEMMQLGLITFCAYGWMTTYKVSDKEQMFYPIAAVLGFISIVLSLLSKINDGEPQKTHLYDSIPFSIQIGLKFITLIIFLVGIYLFSSQNRKNKPLISYIVKLFIFGLFCFISMPLYITVFSNWISIHNRWSTVFIGVEVLRIIQIVIISWEVFNQKSIYRKVTMHGRSFMESQNKYL